jgi:hypothetical protein
LFFVLKEKARVFTRAFFMPIDIEVCPIAFNVPWGAAIRAAGRVFSR